MMGIFELVSSREDSFFDDFLREVAFKGLTPYHKIIQTGAREGISLGEHVLTGDMLIEQLKDICHLTPLEEKITLAAYTVHDINKTKKFQEKGLSLKKASNQNILQELNRVNFTTIFPEVGDYIKEIGYLVRNHSAKFHSMEGMLAPQKQEFQLEADRLEQLLALIRGVDVADLSREFQEQYQKEKFLSHINKITDKQYQLINHRVSEQRGILTNMIHNAVSQHLQEQYNCLPVFMYPKGTYYLTDRKNFNIGKTEFDELTIQVKKKVNKVVKGKFDDFINSTSTGIKIDSKCLDLEVPFRDVMAVVDNRIHSKNYNDNQHKKTKEKIMKNLKKLDDKTAPTYRKFFMKLVNKPFQEEEFYTGELIRTYYNLVKLDQFGLSSNKAWKQIYQLLEVDETTETYFELLSGIDAIYYRHYVLARYLMKNKDLDYDELYQSILEAGQKLIVDLQDNSKESLFQRYIYRILSINSKSFITKQEFKDNFNHYLEKPRHQCSTCGLDYEVEDWMAGDVQDNIKVQFFSNRLPGGGGEPKRNICKICNKQFILEKLNFIAHSQTNTFYLHFYPETFHAAIFINSLAHSLHRLRDTDNQALMLKNDQIIIDQLNNQTDRTLQLKFSQTKALGNPLPQYPEVVGNIITLPLNCPGQNTTQRFIFALQQILIWMRYFNFRGILSQAPVPPLSHNEFDKLYLDFLPFNLSGIITEQNLTTVAVNKLWSLLKYFYSLSSQVDTGTDRRDIYAKLMRTASDDFMELFFVLDRLIIKKANNVGEEITISKQALVDLENIFQEGGISMESVEVIEKMGRIAGESYIKGKSFKRNSILKPVDIIFNLLERKSEYIDLESLFASAIQDIFDHLRRISPEDRQPGDTKYSKIENFVNVFQKELLEGIYQGKINELIADQKVIKSAYLFYYRKATKKEDNK